MSFHGPQQKHAMRTHRATKRAEAEARNELAAKRAQAARIVAAEKEEDVTYIADRDALAKALSVARDPGEHSPLCSDDALCRYCYRLANALIASGAVIDAATLADDEALRFTDEDIENAYEAMGEGEWQWFQWLLREKVRALTAALTERAR